MYIITKCLVIDATNVYNNKMHWFINAVLVIKQKAREWCDSMHTQYVCITYHIFSLFSQVHWLKFPV